MGRTVILRHTLANGDWHLDWMVEAAPPVAPDPDRPLVTFRTDFRLDQAGGSGAFRAERIEDHRATYLTYEGPLSQGRGSVERLAVGTCHLEVIGHGGLRAEIRFGQGEPRVWLGRNSSENAWDFQDSRLADRP